MDCPQCRMTMELKIEKDLFAPILAGNPLTIWQCPDCKNIEVTTKTSPAQWEAFKNETAAKG